MSGRRKSFLCIIGILILSIAPAAMATSRLFDFEGTEYGANDPTCAGTGFPSDFHPPMFNMAIYGTQTSAYLDGAAECGGGALGANPINVGSYSFLTNYYAFSPSKSEELRFSWLNPGDGNSWARIPAFSTSTAQPTPVSPSPTIDIRPGSSVKINFLLYLTDTSEAENTSGNIELALLIRETGLNLPLGEDGGQSGTVEYVGITTAIGTSKIPAGATVMNDDPAWHSVEWTFKADNTKVDVSIDGGAPTELNVVGLSGDGQLSAPFNRATLDSLVVIKGVSDTTTKKVFFNVDDVEIKAPTVSAEPVQIVKPLVEFMTTATVKYIDPTATLIKLYANGSQIASANPSGNTEYTFTGLTLHANDSITAKQVVGGLDSDPSAPVIVASAIIMTEDFEAYANTDALYTAWEWGVTAPTNQGVWDEATYYWGDQVSLSNITAASCSKSAQVPWSCCNGTYRLQAIRRIPGALEAGGYNGSDEVPLVLTLWIQHDAGNDGRNYIELAGFANHTYANGSFKQRVRMGMYSSASTPCTTLDTNLYQGQFLQGYTGCVANLDEGPGGATAVRTGGQWVKYRIRIKTSTVEFLVDDVLYKALPRTNAIDTFDTIEIGSGYTNNFKVMYVDNICLSYGDRDPFPDPVRTAPTVVPPAIPGTGKSVTVNNIATGATSVKLYADGVVIASATPSGTSYTFTGLTLTTGQRIQAGQDVGGLTGCPGKDWIGVQNPPAWNSLTVSLILRDAMSVTGPVGADGGTPSGALEFLGATSLESGAPIGKTITPGPSWQTFTFNAATDPAISFSGGNNVIDGNGPEKWCVLDAIAIKSNQDSPKMGPYTLYVDSIENDGVVFGNFEHNLDNSVTYQPGNPVLFHTPGYSGSTSGNVGLDTTSAVSDEQGADGTAQSCKLTWTFIDEIKSRWIRVTTASMAQMGNPMVRMDKPVTVKMMLCGAPYVMVANPLTAGDTSVTVLAVDTAATTVKVYVNGTVAASAPGNGTNSVVVVVPALAANDVVQATQTLTFEGCLSAAVLVEGGIPPCNTPQMDTNGDLHVDATDFDTFSACYNGPTNLVSGDCLCVDANGDQYVDATDFDTFSACYNGPTNPPRCGS